jgi:hypothetical protein
MATWVEVATSAHPGVHTRLPRRPNLFVLDCDLGVTDRVRLRVLRSTATWRRRRAADRRVLRRAAGRRRSRVRSRDGTATRRARRARSIVAGPEPLRPRLPPAVRAAIGRRLTAARARRPPRPRVVPDGRRGTAVSSAPAPRPRRRASARAAPAGPSDRARRAASGRTPGPPGARRRRRAARRGRAGEAGRATGPSPDATSPGGSGGVDRDPRASATCARRHDAGLRGPPKASAESEKAPTVVAPGLGPAVAWRDRRPGHRRTWCGRRPWGRAPPSRGAALPSSNHGTTPSSRPCGSATRRRRGG